jgi:hypothetical protein
LETLHAVMIRLIYSAATRTGGPGWEFDAMRMHVLDLIALRVAAFAV